MSQPCARVTTVCTATAWKMDAAMFSLLTFLATRFWMSVLQKTPHLEATGYILSAREARSFSSSAVTPRMMAIWSMNAPVPPAQFPFILRSEASPSLKKTTLASSPPMSIRAAACGQVFLTALVAATTSCTNGKEHFSDMPIPTDPVTQTPVFTSPVTAISFSSNPVTVSLARALCLSYPVNMTFPFSSAATTLAVVDPASIPIFIIFR